MKKNQCLTGLLIFVPRMGVAKKALGNYCDSRKYLERALRIDPTNADVIRQMVIHPLTRLVDP